MGRFRGFVHVLCVLFLAACQGSSGTPSRAPSLTPTEPSGASAGASMGAPLVWSRPADPMGLATRAGLTPDKKEYIDYHVHAHLDVFVDGLPVEIPSGIGINPDDPAVEEFGTEIGGIPPEGCAEVCISPLHTHDIDGIIHVEAQTPAQFTLGQFFEQLTVRLDSSCVDQYCAPDTAIAVYVNGEQQSGNPADIVFADMQEIAIVIGTPPAQIPDSFPGG